MVPGATRNGAMIFADENVAANGETLFPQSGGGRSTRGESSDEMLQEINKLAEIVGVIQSQIVALIRTVEAGHRDSAGRLEQLKKDVEANKQMLLDSAKESAAAAADAAAAAAMATTGTTAKHKDTDIKTVEAALEKGKLERAAHLLVNGDRMHLCELFVSYMLNVQEDGYLGPLMKRKEVRRPALPHSDPLTHPPTHSLAPPLVTKVLSNHAFLDAFAESLLGQSQDIPSDFPNNNRIELKTNLIAELQVLGKAHVLRFAQAFHGVKTLDQSHEISGAYGCSELKRDLDSARASRKLVTEQVTGGEATTGLTDGRLDYGLYLKGEEDDMGSQNFIGLARSMAKFVFPARHTHGAIQVAAEGTVDAVRVVFMSAAAIAMLMWLVNYSEVDAHGKMDVGDANSARRRYGNHLWAQNGKRVYQQFLSKVRSYVARASSSCDNAPPRLVLLDDQQMALMFRNLGLDVDAIFGSSDDDDESGQ